MLVAKLQIRVDTAGSGHFGVSRDGGKRTHNGIDYRGIPGDTILSPVEGRVVKHGFAYGDDLQWTYIQIDDVMGLEHRFFYITERAPVGTEVQIGDSIGRLQDITRRYPGRGMKAHCHYGVRRVESGRYIYYNPEDLNAPPLIQLRR